MFGGLCLDVVSHDLKNGTGKSRFWGWCNLLKFKSICLTWIKAEIEEALQTQGYFASPKCKYLIFAHHVCGKEIQNLTL